MAAPVFYPYRQSSIAAYQFGSGKETVFCFHGYGEQGDAFAFLETYAGTDYRFISIDLPFHGKTEWKEGLLFTPADLAAIVSQINPDPGAKISLLGFSLGGRVAMSLYQMMPEKIDRMILLAPDGLKVNFWYRISTQTYLGNKLFALTMKKPHWFFGLLKGMNALRLVNASIFKFVNYYIGDETVRDLLYRRWTTLRKLKPDLKKLKREVVLHQTRLQLVYGKHDRIILPARGEALAAALPEHCQVTIIESGHQVLHEKHVKDILKALGHPGR